MMNWYRNKFSIAPTATYNGANYIEPTKKGDANLATRRGGCRFLIGLLIREFGYQKVKEDFLIVEAQYLHKQRGGKFR